MSQVDTAPGTTRAAANRATIIEYILLGVLCGPLQVSVLLGVCLLCLSTHKEHSKHVWNPVKKRGCCFF